MRKIMLTTLGGALLLGAGGCGTLSDLAREARPFGGIQTDIEAIGDAGCKAAVVVPIAIIDLPFSAVLDLVVLPGTAIHALTE